MSGATGLDAVRSDGAIEWGENGMTGVARVRTVIGTLLLVALTGCGTTDGVTGESNDTGEAAGSAGELEAAATEAFMAWINADDRLFFDRLSTECRDQLGFAAVEGHLQGRRFTARDLGGIDLGGLSVAAAGVDVNGSTGTVTLEIEGTTEQLVESTPRSWIYEDGGWRMADCSDIGAAQGGIDDEGTDRAEPVGYGFIADIEGWLTVVTWIDPNGEEIAVEGGADPASDGNQLFTVGVTFTYNGASTSASLSDLSFAMVNGDTVYGDESSCHHPGSDIFLDFDATAEPGETVGSGQILCWEVPSDAVEGMLLRVTHTAGGGEWWFDLSQP